MVLIVVSDLPVVLREEDSTCKLERISHRENREAEENGWVVTARIKPEIFDDEDPRFAKGFAEG